MPYDSLTDFSDASATVPEDVSNEMLNKATVGSAALSMFRRVPVSRRQKRFPVLSALPLAYFVEGDTGLKQTTSVAWSNKYLNIEEAAVILPIPDNVIADAEIGIWDEAMPHMVEAFNRLIDDAIFFGTNAPSTWPTNINAAATAAGNTNAEDQTAAQGGFLGDVDDTIGLVEADGFDVSGFVAARSARSKFRKARDTTGQKIDTGRVAGDLGSVDGLPIAYPMRGQFPATVRLFAGDWSQFVIGVRSDITMKVLTEAVIQDNTGAIVYNLAQQDMSAVRLTFRLGWQVANLLNHDQPTEANRYPVAVQTF